MNVEVRVTKSFKAAVKPLLKKYPSLSADLLRLDKDLRGNPTQGTPLGHNVYKIRLKIASKGKGKSGGARVISLIESVIVGEVQQTEQDIFVNLITIYDKAVTANITDRELRDLIKAFHHDK